MSRSGMLNKVIGLWRKTVQKDQYGEISEQWSEIRKLRAYIYRQSGSQVIDNDEIFDVIRLEVKIRNQVDVKEVDRLNIYGNMYQIEFIQPDYTDRWLNIKAVRINE